MSGTIADDYGRAYREFRLAVKSGSHYRIVPDGHVNSESGEATDGQAAGVRHALHDRPISSMMIFRAGWNAARLAPTVVGTPEREAVNR